MRHPNRSLLILIIVIIAVAGAGLVADDDDEEDSLETNYPARAASSMVLTKSVINAINDRYCAIEPILRKACYDCHSASTHFPWYHSLPLVGSMMDDHIRKGREHLDFTDGFPFGGDADQLKLLFAIRREIESGEMPLLAYRLMHRGTKIDGERRDSVFSWIDQTTGLLQGQIQSGP